MSNDTSYHAYWNSVDELADVVVQRERDGDDIGDALREAVECSWWTIYSYASWAVMEHTRNDDYGLENGLIDIAALKVSSFNQIVTIFAYWAMYADVQDRLDEARERWQAAHPEASEEVDVTPENRGNEG